MSLLSYGITSLGSIIYNTHGAVLREGKEIVQAVCAVPCTALGSLKNNTVAAVSTLVIGTLQVASLATTAIKNKVSSKVDTVKSAATGLRNGAVQLLSAGKDAVIATVLQDSADLFFRIITVGDKIFNDLSAKAPVSQVNRNELAERLEEFVELHRLKKEDKKFIIDFCTDLKNADVIFNTSKEVEMRRLEKILEPYFTQNERYILSKKAERDQLEKLPGVTTSASPKLTPQATLSGIEVQLELLKSNSIKLILGSIILNMTLGMSTFKGIDCKAIGIAAPPDGENTNLINYLIEISTSEKDFQDLMYRIIDHSGKNIFTRLYAKMQCGMAYGLVLNLVGNIFDNLKINLVEFANLPPAKQLEEISQLLINPLLGHLSAIDGSLPADQAASIPKTADALLDKFIEAFLDQFLDKKYQPWTRTYRAICIERASRSDLMAKVFYSTLSVLLWIAGKCTAPIHWAINETIHGVLKKVIVGLCPSLSEATKSSLDIGTDNAWYGLKNSLVLMFQQIRLNSLLPRAEDPVYQPQKELPIDVKEKLTAALDKLFKILAIPDESLTADPGKSSLSIVDAVLTLVLPDGPSSEEDLRNFLLADGKALTSLLQKNMHGSLSGLKDIIKNAVADLLLEMLVQDGFFNGTLLSSLTSINASGFASRPSPVVPTEEKQRVEVELQKELGLLGGTILHAVDQSTRADTSAQWQANVHITSLQQQVQAFNQTLLQIKNTKDLSFKKSALVACEQFDKSMEKFEAEITKTVDASTKALLMPHLNQARDGARQIAENFFAICPIEEKRRQVEAKLNKLYPLLENPLANQAEMEEVIDELCDLNASFLDVNGLIKDINESHKIYLKRLASSKGGPLGAYTKPFMTKVAYHKKMANTAAIAQIKQHKIDSTRRSAAQLSQWANKLQFVKVATKPTAKDAGMAAVYNSPVVKAATGAALQAYGRNLFTFIGDAKNLGGIAQRGMEAYLSKPPMMLKKQRPKVGIY